MSTTNSPVPKKTTKILVLGGGDSPEREVSLRSSQCISDALIDAGFSPVLYDPIDMNELAVVATEYDIVLPILHGKNGEDGVVQAVLEQANIPYLGSTAAVSALCMDKVKTKAVLHGAGLRVPNGLVVEASSLLEFIDMHPLYVLKPIDGGSSIDTIIVSDLVTDKRAEALALTEQYGHLLAEEYIEGIEVTVPILGDSALEPILIVPPEGKEFDYENKYNGATQEICPIPREIVADPRIKELQSVALSAHNAVGARHLSRVDIIITQDGVLNVLEVNTIPGMTNQSLLPKAALVAGLDMPAFATRLVELTLNG